MRKPDSSVMISSLKLLPKSLTTFLYAVAALLRFYGDSESIPFPLFRFSVVDRRSLKRFCGLFDRIWGIMANNCNTLGELNYGR
jgi:hypothetical protein